MKLKWFFSLFKNSAKPTRNFQPRKFKPGNCLLTWILILKGLSHEIVMGSRGADEQSKILVKALVFSSNIMFFSGTLYRPPLGVNSKLGNLIA
jgi:hypothetical protein